VTTHKSEFRVQDAYTYNRKSPARWIISHALRYRLFAAGALVFKTVALIAYSSAPVFVGRAAEAMIRPAPGGSVADPLLMAGLAVLIALLSDGITNLIGSLSVEVIAQKLEADSREELYGSLLGKSQTFHDRQRAGDIMARATDDVKQPMGC
jgi:ATP-binding cassette subfamily B protein